MSQPDTTTRTDETTAIDQPWNVIIHDDPINLMAYVTWVIRKIFSYPEPRAASLMLEVHQQGRAVVWTGQREMAEFYTQQLHAHQLKSSLERRS